MRDRLQDALKYAALGWKVFPLAAGTKVPLKGSGGVHDATTDTEQIKEWFTGQDYNIGVDAASVGLMLDVDVKNGHQGPQSLAALVAVHGELPTTVYQTTPSFGFQYLFKLPLGVTLGNSEGDLGDGIDTKGVNGYFVAPPSFIKRNLDYHYEGPYEWITEQGPFEMEIAQAPDWLIRLCQLSNGELKVKKPLPSVISTGNRNATLTSIAGTMRRRGLSQEAIEAALLVENKKCSPPLDDIEVLKIAKSVAQYEPKQQTNIDLNVNTLIQVNNSDEEKPSIPLSEIQQSLEITQTQRGLPVCNISNALKVLEGCEGFKEDLWYDDFYQKIFTTWRTGVQREWSDSETIALQVFMQRLIGLSRISKEAVFDAVLSFARTNSHNEPKEWMDSLVWDGIPRIEKLFIDYFGSEDTEYIRAVSKNFAISLAARIYHPGCKVDTMPVIEGPQGSLKSTAAETLVGKKLYCEAHENVTTKDFFQILQGKLLVEISELDAFNRAEVTRIKQVITCNTDRYRASYGHCAEDHPRTCVFIGTTNEIEYLRDTTGARRFWPIKVGFINIPRIKEDRDQIFAEAVQLFKAGATWWEMPISTQDEQEDRRQIDPWEDTIRDYIKSKLEVTTADILTSCLKIDVGKQTKPDQMKAGNILRLLGWGRKKERVGDETRWVYRKVPRSDVPTLNEGGNKVGTRMSSDVTTVPTVPTLFNE